MPQDLVLVKQAWRRYTETGSLDLHVLRPEVGSSWQRCHNLNINPHQGACDGHGDLVQLRQRVIRKGILIGIARPMMERLYAFVKGTGFEIVLADETGFVLDVLGDDDILARTKQLQLCPGGDWSEASKGTNAIGMAIFERRPVQVLASEHYCEGNHFLVCSASPIFDPDAQMIGVLGISGHYHFATPHTLGMVVVAAGTIENQLLLRKSKASLSNTCKHFNAVLERMSDGVISVDTRGFLTGLNRQGARILGVDANTSFGQHISEVLWDSPSLRRMLTEHEAFEEREIPLRAGARLASSVSVLRAGDGSVIGSVAVFREVGCSEDLPRRLPQARYTLDDIVGTSAAITQLRAWAKQVAMTPSTVLIEGESGTGKELFAQAIHAESARQNFPFVAVNCAALPETLIESELFGYEDGAFTGARQGSSPGKFEWADGGTLFLDEVSAMPAAVQMKVLRAIQEKTVLRIGSGEERRVDIRIIAATSKNLKREVEQGRFREDLYHRLHLINMHIPPLREHSEDIPALARHLVEKIATKLRLGPFNIEDRVMEALRAYAWPGNVRELENAIERAMLRSSADRVLSADGFDLASTPPAAKRKLSIEPEGLKSLRETEREMILNALSFYSGNVQKAAGNRNWTKHPLS